MMLKTRTDVYAGCVEMFDDVVNNCQDIIRILENKDAWNDAIVNAGDAAAHNPNERNNSVTFFNPLDFRCEQPLHDFAKTIWHYVDDYAKRYGVRFSYMEPVNVNKYGPGERYKPHADDGPGVQTRVVSALVYLNDVTEGGGTEFVFHGVTVYPKAGRLIIFPSNYAYSHAAHPPVNGVKYSAAFWMGK